MVIRIALPDLDLASVPSLTERLEGVIETASIWLDGGRREVRVLAELESESAVMHVIDAVQNWLAEAGAASAALSIGDRCYTLVGPGQLAGAQ
jgi:hypothetical protein